MVHPLPLRRRVLTTRRINNGAVGINRIPRSSVITTTASSRSRSRSVSAVRQTLIRTLPGIIRTRGFIGSRVVRRIPVLHRPAARPNDAAAPETVTIPLIPTRVILACDENFKYIQFWEPVAAHWKQIHGLKPTLFFIGSPSTPINTTIGEVIRVSPIPGVPTSLTAQLIRLVAPSLFPNEVCVISDIDMFLLDSQFFSRYLNGIPGNHWVSLNRYPYSLHRVSMCYQVAIGSLFGSIFHCSGSMDSIIQCIKNWAAASSVWGRDEDILTGTFINWSLAHPGRWHNIHVPGLWGVDVNKANTISRYLQNMAYDEAALQQHRYIEFEPPRPLLPNLGTVKHILSVALPQFIFPDITYEGIDTKSLRHPWDIQQLKSIRGPRSHSVPPSRIATNHHHPKQMIRTRSVQRLRRH